MLDLFDDFKLAEEARKFSKPGSTNFAVGAVLKCKSGKKYVGCNIDNDGIQAICAERVAFVKAISEGETDFEYIVVVGGPKEEIADTECIPCGYCRQFMHEYVKDDFKIFTINKGEINEYLINDLLPYGFSL